MSFKELINRASVANVTAAIILVGAVIYAVYTRDVEISNTWLPSQQATFLGGQ